MVKIYTKIIALVIMISSAFGANNPFYCGNGAGDNEHLWHMRDGTVALAGLYVQKCVSGANGANDYGVPRTNETATSGNWLGNFLPADCTEYQIGTCKMQDDDASVDSGGQFGAPGNVSGEIGSSDATRRGWLRCFSSTTITGSAYYGDTPGNDANRLLNATDMTYEWSADPTNDIVNPAYTIPFSVTTPTDYQQGGGVANSLPVSGTCSGTAAIPGNNQLQDTIVSIKWENITFSPVTNGWIIISGSEWNGSVVFSNCLLACVVTNTLTFQAIGVSARPGFPISSVITRHYINIPEPAIFGMTALAALVFFRRKY